MGLRGAGAEPSRISSGKGQFVVNGAYPNAVKNALSEKRRGRAETCATLQTGIGSRDNAGPPLPRFGRSPILKSAPKRTSVQDLSRAASRRFRDRSAAPRL